MDELYKQVQVYLNMDEEIGFKEFRAYYQEVLTHLDTYADQLEEEDIWKGLFVVESIMSNAENRAKQTKNKTEAKKYKKMTDRTKLYAQHSTKRLHEMGYDQEQISERFEQMLEDGSTAETNN